MTEHDIRTFLHAQASGICRDVMTMLRADVGVPPSMLHYPATLGVYINNRHVMQMIWIGDRFLIESRSADSWVETREEACYMPERDRICFTTASMEASAVDAALTPAQLLEILTAHEFVHVLMIDKFIRSHSPVLLAWWRDIALRGVHESVALYICARFFAGKAGVVDDAAVRRYLAFVRAMAAAPGRNGGPYADYFERYAAIPAGALWARLQADHPRLADIVEESVTA